MHLPRSSLILLGAGLLIGAGLGVLVLAIWVGGAAWFERPASVLEARQPEAAPDFELRTLEGEHIRLSDLRGRAVVINFWATWCGPCRIEMPILQKYHERYPDELAILGVNFKEAGSIVQNYVNELGLTFTVLLDPTGEVEDLYRVRAFPTTFFIDAQGNIINQHIGSLEEDQLVQYLEQVGVK